MLYLDVSQRKNTCIVFLENQTMMLLLSYEKYVFKTISVLNNNWTDIITSLQQKFFYFFDMILDDVYYVLSN